MPVRYPCALECAIKAHGAAEEKGNQVVAPVVLDVGHLTLDGTVAVDPILWEIRTHIGTGRSGHGFVATLVQHLQDGARFGVALGEDEKIVSVLARQDNKASLGVARGHATAGSGELATPDCFSDLPRAEVNDHRRIGDSGHCNKPPFD